MPQIPPPTKTAQKHSQGTERRAWLHPKLQSHMRQDKKSVSLALKCGRLQRSPPFWCILRRPHFHPTNATFQQLSDHIPSLLATCCNIDAERCPPKGQLPEMLHGSVAPNAPEDKAGQSAIRILLFGPLHAKRRKCRK